MIHDVVELIMDIKIYSFFEKHINYVYRIDTLKNFDRETIKYNSEEEFFLDHKEDILKNIQASKKKYGLTMDIVDIDLGHNGVYILMKNQLIYPLFKNINTEKGIVSLEDIIKNKMRNNNLAILYEIDKEYKDMDNYESVFINFSSQLLNYLEEGFYSPIIDRCWYNFQKLNRFSEIVRFLSLNGSKEKMKRLYSKIVSPKENMEKDEEKEKFIRAYRSPYKDD
jgi:hypothetical protein